MAVVVVLVVITTYFSNFCLTSLLQGPLLSSSAWFDILDHIKGTDGIAMSWRVGAFDVVYNLCPGKVDYDDDDDESVKFTSY